MPETTALDIPAPVMRRIADATDTVLDALALLEPLVGELQTLAATTAVLADDPGGDGRFDPYMEACGWHDIEAALGALLWAVQYMHLGRLPGTAEKGWEGVGDQIRERVSARRLEQGLPTSSTT